MSRLSIFKSSHPHAKNTRRGEESRNSVTAAADPANVSVGSITVAAPRRVISALDVQLSEAHNAFGAGLSAEGLRLAQLARPSRARAYARAADVRFESGEWRS